MEPRLYSYKMTNDSGFAPNPFWGILTPVTRKASTRRSKKVGDWIAGFTSGAQFDYGVHRVAVDDLKAVWAQNLPERKPPARARLPGVSSKRGVPSRKRA